MDEALEAAVTAAEKAAKSAKRATVLMLLGVAIAVAVLAIDNGIKQAIVNEARNARNLFDELKQTIAETRKEVKGGTTAAGETGDPAGPSLNGVDGVVDDAPAGKVLGEAPSPPKRAPARKPAGTRRGPRRDG